MSRDLEDDGNPRDSREWRLSGNPRPPRSPSPPTPPPPHPPREGEGYSPFLPTPLFDIVSSAVSDRSKIDRLIAHINAQQADLDAREEQHRTSLAELAEVSQKAAELRTQVRSLQDQVPVLRSQLSSAEEAHATQLIIEFLLFISKYKCCFDDFTIFPISP